jgi:hypothetical protein
MTQVGSARSPRERRRQVCPHHHELKAFAVRARNRRRRLSGGGAFGGPGGVRSGHACSESRPPPLLYSDNHAEQRAAYTSHSFWLSALRSPPSALRPPPSALRFPPSALRFPPSALRSPLSAFRPPLSTLNFSRILCEKFICPLASSRPMHSNSGITSWSLPAELQASGNRQKRVLR